MFEKFNELKERIEEYRDKVQSGEKKPSNWKKKWQKYSSKLYVMMFIFSITGYVFFNCSRLLFNDDSPLVDSGVGEVSKTKIGTSEVKIVSRKMNNSTGYGEVLLYVEEEADLVNKEYVSFAGETKQKQPIKTKLQKITDNYYLVHLYNVPKNWKEIALDFGYNATPKAPTTVEQIEEQKNQSREDTSKQTTFYWDKRKSQSNDNLKEQNKEKYLADVIDVEEKSTKEKLKLLTDNNQKIDSEIVKIEDKIKQETDELIYKVGKEKEDAQAHISQLTHEKEKYIEGKKEIENEQNMLKEKLQKLKEKKGKVEVNE